jgi:murein DD-endopeptidase MepM/ murein hydrolase activator NlpD
LGNPAVAATLQTRQPAPAFLSYTTTDPAIKAVPVDPVYTIGEIAAPPPPPPTFVTRQFTLKSGSTLSGILTNAGLSNNEAAEIVTTFSTAFNPRRIKAGQSIELQFRLPTKTAAEQFSGLSFEPTKTSFVRLERDGETFKAWQEDKVLTTKLFKSEGRITSSLYVAGVRAALPLPILAEFIRAYSWDVDFQRSIRKNDEFSVFYEAHLDGNGETVAYGKILFAELILSGDKLPIYLYGLPDGREDYFDLTGRSAKKALMRTPIDGARLSSNYGNRKHPILGYNKLHTGVDFAAPRGTPIYAAGDGAIDYIGRNGGYGNYIRIRHNDEYSTAYAHMKSFARTMKSGKRVRQGQVIGYVGTTGRSTGAHLHYEILKNKRAVNPMKVKMPSGEKLKGKNLGKFLQLTRTRDAQFVALENPSTNIALAN